LPQSFHQSRLVTSEHHLLDGLLEPRNSGESSQQNRNSSLRKSGANDNSNQSTTNYRNPNFSLHLLLPRPHSFPWGVSGTEFPGHIQRGPGPQQRVPGHNNATTQATKCHIATTQAVSERPSYGPIPSLSRIATTLQPACATWTNNVNIYNNRSRQL
jgi:hypothetical protein